MQPILVMTIAGIKEVEHNAAHIGHDNRKVHSAS
jgi:hypothetical protein